MIASIISVLAFGQIKVQLNKPPWRDGKMAAISSSQWKNLRTDALKRIKYLGADSEKNRREKLLSLVRSSNSNPSAEDPYFLSHCLISFPNDIIATKQMGLALKSVSEAPGASDPEFWRVAYTALCLNDGQHPGRKDIGRKLVDLFPSDFALLEAYVWDSARNFQELPQIKHARKLFEEQLKSHLEKQRSVELSCWLNLSIWASTRDKLDYERAKSEMEQYIKYIGDETKKKNMRERLEAYRKKWG